MAPRKLIARLDTPGTRPWWQVFWLQGVVPGHVLLGGILLLATGFGPSA